MVHKIKTLLQYLVLGIGLILSISLIKSISKISHSDEKITEAKEEVIALEKENEDLAKKFSKVESLQFIEKEARDKLGLAQKGEIVVVLPDDNTLRSLSPKLTSKEVNLPDPNWKKWLKLFL